MPPPPPPGGGYPPVMAPPTDSQATVALVLGILSLLPCCWVLGPVAFFLGNAARGRIEASGGTVAGGGMATAGMILGIIGSAFLALIILYVIAVFIGVASGFRPAA